MFAPIAPTQIPLSKSENCVKYEIRSYVFSKLSNIQQLVKYYKFHAVIATLVVILLVLFTVDKVYTTTAAQPSTDRILDTSNFYTAALTRIKRDTSSSKIAPCTKEETLNCEEKFEEIKKEKEPSQYVRNNIRDLDRCLQCMSAKDETPVKIETTTKLSYANMFKNINSRLHNEVTPTTTSVTETVTDNIEQSTESLTTTELDLTTPQNDSSLPPSKSNLDGQKNETEKTMKRVNCGNKKVQLDSTSPQNRNMESNNEPTPEEEAQTQILLPCFMLKGMIGSKEINSVTGQSNGVQLLPFYNPNKGEGKDLLLNGVGAHKDSSNTALQIPFVCTFVDPRYLALGYRKSDDESQDTSYPMQNSVWNSVFKRPSFRNELKCPSDAFSCADNSQCILKSKWCNSYVDCPDASDETKCNCKDRLKAKRICDGHFDCPLGEDEVGCYGCDSASFSCENEVKEVGQSNCIPITQRCDDTEQCNNGRDEEDCIILSKDEKVIGIGFNDGFLHKNFNGTWYPVRGTYDPWIKQACQIDIGTFPENPPDVQTKPGYDHIKFCINIQQNGSFDLTSDCSNLTYVTCDKMQCGITSLELTTGPIFDKNSTNDIVSKNNDMVGIVGGKSSRPSSWPFLVMILIDGIFECGGNIIDERWILTAAHCLLQIKNDTNTSVEVRSGMLRKESYEPSTQIRRAVSIHKHPQFIARQYDNDIALIHLSEGLNFNKWVKPVCLPSVAKEEYVDGPLPETMCTVIGWGRKAESGPRADNLKEVEVKIQRTCVHNYDKIDQMLCAGFDEGGKDACGGDSGGPLLCRSSDNTRWYVAGIVSHGIGCGQQGEYGVYTRVKSFSNWIEEVMTKPSSRNWSSDNLMECKGFVCNNPKGRCLAPGKKCDKVVDCLDAEDEVDCPGNSGVTDNTNNDISGCEPNNESVENGEISENIIDDSEQSHKNIDKNEQDKDENSVQKEETTMRSQTEYSTENISDSFSTTVTISSAQTEFSIVSSTETSTVNEPILADSSSATETGPSKMQLKQEFFCNRLPQLVSLDAHCDRKIDCEDGFDEENCNCRDFLMNLSPENICNGRYDCKDHSDEKDCDFCSDDQFKCGLSNQCVYARQRCDRVNDCPNGEDEADCYALSNGQTIHLDWDERPHTCHTGILTEYQNGNWTPTIIQENLVQNESELHEIAKSTCNYIGFSNVRDIEIISIQNKTIPQEKININGAECKYSSEYHTDTNATHRGLKITCEDTLQTPSIEMVNQPVPWQAALYVEGQFRCTAILLDNYWMLSAQRCLQDVDPHKNYTVAVLGLSPTYKIDECPYQQIIPIDSIVDVQDAEGKILHLKHRVNRTRHVQPIFLEKKFFPPSEEEKCILLADNVGAESTTLILKSTTDDCPQCSRCFSVDEETNSTTGKEDNETSSWSGTVSCLGSGGWYPAAIFNELNISNFTETEAFTSIEFFVARVFEAEDKHKIVESQFNCSGTRCSLGNCIPLNRLCNSITNCRDGSDEFARHCTPATTYRQNLSNTFSECEVSELRCANQRCVPKGRFCDRYDDCGDRSDEPGNCSCGQFLKLSQPWRVCDGKRDCFDKSDEGPDLCNSCITNRLCTGSQNKSICLIDEYICDGEEDCMDGSDESVCRILVPFNTSTPNVGRLIQKAFGEKYSVCWDDPANLTSPQYLCESFNFKTGDISDSIPEIDSDPIQIEVDPFYIVKLNDFVSLSLRKDVPMVRNIKPNKPCNQVFLECH